MTNRSQIDFLTSRQWELIRLYFKTFPDRLNDPFSDIRMSLKRFTQFTVTEYAFKEIRRLLRKK